MFRGDIDDRALETADAVVIDEAEHVRLATVYVEADRIDALRAVPNVLSVEVDQIVEAQQEEGEDGGPSGTDGEDGGSAGMEGADWGEAAVGAPNARRFGLTGAGVDVAVIDTGVAPHDDIAVAFGRSFVDYTDSYEDDNGHGTHVAGIIAAKDDGVGIVGVAPDANVIALKVLNALGYGLLSDTIRALDWCIANGVDVVNLSLGMERPSAALKRAVDKTYASGILIVSAAGNFGTEDGEGDTVEYPAKYESTIAVSAVQPDGERASFSATGPAVEASAPGVFVASTYLGNGYAVQDGTSMAAPFVTGVLALYRQLEPEASAAELREALQATALDLGKPGRDEWFGFGLAQTPPAFHDVFGHWAYGDIAAVFRRGWMTGMTPGSFDPERTVTRAQAAVVLARALGLASAENEEPAQLETPFEDIAEHWARADIEAVRERGVMLGMTATRFAPEAPVTREQMAAVLVRWFELERTPDMPNPFADAPEGRWSTDAVVAAAYHGLFVGLRPGRFGGEVAVDRAQLAALLRRAFDDPPTS